MDPLPCAHCLTWESAADVMCCQLTCQHHSTSYTPHLAVLASILSPLSHQTSRWKRSRLKSIAASWGWQAGCHAIFMPSTIEDDSDFGFGRRGSDSRIPWLTDLTRGTEARPCFCQRGDQVISRSSTLYGPLNWSAIITSATHRVAAELSTLFYIEVLCCY